MSNGKRVFAGGAGAWRNARAEHLAMGPLEVAPGELRALRGPKALITPSEAAADRIIWCFTGGCLAFIAFMFLKPAFGSLGVLVDSGLSAGAALCSSGVCWAFYKAKHVTALKRPDGDCIRLTG